MANLPSPIVGPGGSGGRGVGEAVLLAIASAAPGMLMQFLNQRQQMGQQNADIEAQGQASTSILAEMARNGTLSPELFRSAGGSYVPGRTVEGSTTPSGIKLPTLSTETRIGTGGINTRVAPQLLQQLMGTQQATSSTADIS